MRLLRTSCHLLDAARVVMKNIKGTDHWGWHLYSVLAIKGPNMLVLPRQYKEKLKALGFRIRKTRI